ncbi:MAG: pitrilysin family protein [Candidatus Eisenbacteria bacterium]
MSPRSTAALACATMLGLATAALAAAPSRTPSSSAPALSPASFKVERDTLENGLTILYHEDHSVPAVCFWQWFKVGSRNERQGITGLSHFFEHMMFNGSGNVQPKEYDRRLESQGAYSNAFTSHDMTAYYEEGGTQSLETMFELDADRMRALSLLPAMLKSEIEVVREERRFRTDNSVPGLLEEALYSTAFFASPYGWPVVGWMSDLERITRDEMVNYFRTYYAPNNCIMLVVGDYDAKTIRAQIRRHFGSIPRQTPPPRPVNSEPEQLGERRAEVHYPSETVSFQVGYKAPSVQSADGYTLQVLSTILSEGESSRLHQALVYSQRIALSARASYSPGLEPGLFELSVEMAPSKTAAQGEAALYAELERLAKDGPTERELQKARNQAEASFVRQLKTNNGAGQTLGFYEHVYGDYRKMFSAIDRYRAVTAADCKRVAKEIFNSRKRTVAVLVPEAAAQGEAK